MAACPRRELLAALLDEQLPTSERDLLEGHLDDCTACQQALLELSGDPTTWQRCAGLLHSPQDDPLVPDDLLSHLKSAHQTEPRGTRAAVPFVPGYELLGELGHGGMAVVYRARQIGLNRLVALKMILAGAHATAELRDRFRREAEAVARLQHPNIVQIHDIGEHDGLPYFSMELVEGGNLSRHLDGTPYAPVEAAALVETLARAIHAAHEAGIVHRDLKPANVLLSFSRGSENRAGAARFSEPRLNEDVPKITDFGIALHLDSARGWTRSGEVLGTPSYMAPEQAQGRRRDVGPATDVHALGVILYELLTGRLPFQAEDEVSTLVQVSFEEPVPPRRLNPTLPRDLETICLKCLRKLPRQRYASACDLADDLHRFRGGEPIQARPISTGERVVKWARRRPLVALLLAGMVILVVGGFTGVTLALVEARTARNEEAQQRRHAEAASTQAQQAAERAERSVYFGNIVQARSLWLLNNVSGSARVLDSCRPERRGWEWHFLRGLHHADLLTINDTGGPWVTGVAYSPDGRWIASSGGDPFALPEWGVLQVHDAVTGRLLWRKTGLSLLVRNLAFSPDGRYLASAGGNWRGGGGKLLLWDAATGEGLRQLLGDEAAAVISIAFSPDGRLLAATSPGQPLRVCDTSSGKERYRLPSAPFAGTVAFTADGRFLVCETEQGIAFHEAAGGKFVRAYPQLRGTFALNPEGSRLATVSKDQIRIWDVSRVGVSPTGENEVTLIQAFNGHTGDITAVTFSPDGQRVATAGTDGTVQVWNLSSGAQPVVYRGHEGGVAAVAFHPDGRRLASGGKQPGNIKVWDATRTEEFFGAVSFAIDCRDITALAFTGEDQELLVLGLGGVLRRWNCFTGLTRDSLLPCTNEWLVPATPAAFSSDGQLLAAVAPNDDRVVKVVQTTTGREVSVLRGHTVRVWHVACDARCDRVVTAAFGIRDKRPLREVKVWDARTGNVLREDSAFEQISDGVALSPDGSQLAEAYRLLTAVPEQAGRFAVSKAELRLSAATNLSSHLLQLPIPGEVVTALAFSPDGRYLAAAGNAGAVRLWDRAGKALHEGPLPGPPGLSALAFHPDGSRLAGVNRERVQVWDVSSGQDVLFLRGAGPRPSDNGFNPRVAWSHDGKRLAVSNWDRTTSIWDASDFALPAGKVVLSTQAGNRAMTWHLGCASLYSRPETARAAAFHRERLRALKSLTPEQHRQRGDFYARSAQWDRAAADYAVLFARDLPQNPWASAEYASLLLSAGDLAAYQKLRRRVFAQWADTRDSSVLAAFIHLGSLIPASAAESAQLTRAAQRYQEANPSALHPLICLGLAHYRAGEWEKAKRPLLRAVEIRPKGEEMGLAWVVLALVYLRQGQAEQAKPWLKRVDERLADLWKDFPPARPLAPVAWEWKGILEVRQLRAEAEALRTKTTP
jgi:WD40 repeat protein